MSSGRPIGTGALVFGVLLLLLGVLLLLRNAGIIEVDLSAFWPIVLVAVGAGIVISALGRRSGVSDGVTSFALPRDGVRRLELRLRVGAGRYNLRGGSLALLEASADAPSIAHSVERRGDGARVRLSTAVEGWSWDWRSGLTWWVSVAPDIPTVLDVQAGAGHFDLDLSATALVSATMAIGAAEVRVVLPRPHGEVPVRIEGGAASFTLEVPHGVEARVTTSGLLSTSGPTETPGYSAARDRVTVSVTGGLASVRVLPSS